MELKEKDRIQLLQHFRDHAGHLIIKDSDNELHILKAANIESLRTDNDHDVYITLCGREAELKYIRTNISVLHHFWHRAALTGQSYNLLPICGLSTTKQNPKASNKVKEGLAAKVLIHRPGDFI